MTPASTSSTERPLILAIDAAAPLAGVSVVRGQDVLATLVARGGLAHASQLVSEIDALLTRCELSLGDVDAFAVTLGPGSFTGVRVGLATARGLAFPRGIPVYGVSSLMALALLHPFTTRPILPLIDPRRGMVYAGCFDGSGPWPRPMTPETHVEVGPLLASAPPRALFVGEGAFSLAAEIRRVLGPDAAIAPPAAGEGAAAAVAGYVAHLLAEGAADQVSDLTPRYLQASSAETKRRAPV